MKFQPPDTLAALLAAPHFKPQSFAAFPVSRLAKGTKEYLAIYGTNHPNPIDEALEFYCLNHLVSIIKRHRTLNEPLSPPEAKVCAKYKDSLAQFSRRLMHYMLLIVTREARHLHSPGDTLNKAIAQLYGDEMRKFIGSIRGVNEHGAIALYQESPPPVTIDAYLGAISLIYYKGKWSSSYGGPPWGKITDTVRSFLKGDTTAEMMVDTGYTLAHNTAPMFNKGMLYQNPSASQLIRVLDVQRSGQIPEMIKEEYPTKSLLLDLCDDIRKLYPGELGEYLDWYKVEALGAVRSYPKEKAKQDQKNPKTATPVFIGKQPAKVIGHYEYLPGKTVQVVERMEA